MIVLPKMLNATGNDCLVASVQMACMYWRKERPNLAWKNVPLDFEEQFWLDFYKKGLGYLRPTGMPQNNVKRFLGRLGLPLNMDFQLLEDEDDLHKLIDLNIPPIVIYDRQYYFRQLPGLPHAVILVDHTKEQFVSVDPAFAPKFVTPLSKKDFLESWKQKKNSTVIISPNTYKFLKSEVPSTNLLPYVTIKERGE